MKFYVAGNYSKDKLRCRYIMEDIKRAGHFVTEDWTDPKYDHAPHDLCCRVDCEGIQNADALILYAVFERQYRGAFVEMGLALAWNKPVYIIGNAIDTCVFTAHPLVKKIHYISEAFRAVEVPKEK